MAAAGCKKDKPKPAEDQKPESQPVPSGLSFNDFVPNSAGGDAGAQNAEPGGPNASDPAGETKVIEPGAEPRALRKYTFVLGKTEKRLLTTQKAITQTMEGKTTGPVEGTTKLSIELTPKQNKPTGTMFELKVTKIEIPGAPAQIVPMLAAMAGTSATFEVGPQGKVGDFQAGESAGLQAQPQLAQQIFESLGQGLQLMFVPLPTTPIGNGAKWEVVMQHDLEKGGRKYTLKDLGNEGGSVESAVELSVAKREMPAPNPAGPNADPDNPGPNPGGKMFVEVQGVGHYTQDLRFNSTAKGGGELKFDEMIDMPDPKVTGRRAKVIQSTKIKQTIEAVGK